ncbi:MAG: adenylosuccinate lyase, partial [Clostridia bacterium]|nr:adenylosuccinate lyase [Clostridia bacterium]
MDNEIYVNPLITRYGSKEMSAVFSDDTKFTLWRELWVALAESEKELGLNITEGQIAEMKSNVRNIDYAKAKAKEKEIRHDVMAHIYAFGEAAPSAKPIIHLGATSCYVGDNADIIIFRRAVEIILRKVISTVKKLSDFADKYKSLPTLGFTHYQPAQLVTVGKRATLWMQDLLSDVDNIE